MSVTLLFDFDWTREKAPYEKFERVTRHGQTRGWTPRCVPQVRGVSDERFVALFDAEASALAAAAGGRRVAAGEGRSKKTSHHVSPSPCPIKGTLTTPLDERLATPGLRV